VARRFGGPLARAARGPRVSPLRVASCPSAAPLASTTVNSEATVTNMRPGRRGTCHAYARPGAGPGASCPPRRDRAAPPSSTPPRRGQPASARTGSHRGLLPQVDGPDDWLADNTGVPEISTDRLGEIVEHLLGDDGLFTGGDLGEQRSDSRSTMRSNALWSNNVARIRATDRPSPGRRPFERRVHHLVRRSRSGPAACKSPGGAAGIDAVVRNTLGNSRIYGAIDTLPERTVRSVPVLPARERAAHAEPEVVSPRRVPRRRQVVPDDRPSASHAILAQATAPPGLDRKAGEHRPPRRRVVAHGTGT
jgi:hypothetical protein